MSALLGREELMLQPVLFVSVLPRPPLCLLFAGSVSVTTHIFTSAFAVHQNYFYAIAVSKAT